MSSKTVVEQGLTKLTAIIEVCEKVPPQVVVYFKQTVELVNEKSPEYIVNTEVHASQDKEVAYVQAPFNVLPQVIVSVGVIPQAGNCVQVEREIVQLASPIVQLMLVIIVETIAAFNTLHSIIILKEYVKT